MFKIVNIVKIYFIRNHYDYMFNLIYSKTKVLYNIFVNNIMKSIYE